MGLPTTKDNDIIQAIKTRLAAITAGAEYNYTYPKVYDNHPQIAGILNDSEALALNIRDVSEEQILGSNGTNYYHDCKLGVEIDIIARGSYTAANLRSMKADVLKSIGQGVTWGGLAIYTTYLGAQKNRRDAYGEIISDWTIMIEVQYRKREWSI